MVRKKRTVKIYVEGGGNENPKLRKALREGFTKLFERAGLRGRMPAVVAAGSRNEALADFRDSLKKPKDGQISLLLVDSEGPVKPDHDGKPWSHLYDRDGEDWKRPDGVEDDQAHLMVQMMESWFLADRAALVRYYGSEFDEGKLPNCPKTIEDISKKSILDGLNSALRNCSTKGCNRKHSGNKYSKGAYSFEILELLDPGKVRKASDWAERFFKCLEDLTCK